MITFIALLRAVNVGGTGKLPMSDLKHLCGRAGFDSARIYLASGNVIFESKMSEAEVEAALEARLEAHAGKPMDVFVRTAAQMAEVSANNPSPDAVLSRTVAIVLDGPPDPDALASVTGQEGEDLHLGARETYLRYGHQTGRAKLRIPAARNGTARDMNTVIKLAAMGAKPWRR